MRMLFASDLHRGITESFHVINTLRVSTAVLTGVVQKEVGAGATDRVLEALHSVPDGVSGQNLRAFTSKPAHERDSLLAEIWLFNIFGRYEAWTDSLPLETSDRGCHFPSRGSGANSGSAGFNETFDGLTTVHSLSTAFASSIVHDYRYLGSRIDDALIVYRLFKECRNSLTHSGGRAGERVEQWGVSASTCAADLYVGHGGILADLPILTKGDRVVLNLEQVRAFVALLTRIAFTIDTILLTSSIGHSEILYRWQKNLGSRPIPVRMATLRRGAWIGSRLQPLDIPVPDQSSDLIPYLEESGLIKVIQN